MKRKEITNPLKDFSDETLVNELSRRVKIKEEIAREALIARQSLIYINVDMLLTLVPEHSRTSCSDKNHFNHYEDCVRCWLLFIKEDQGIFDNRELRFELKES
jgi:hypothetical protein